MAKPESLKMVETAIDLLAHLADEEISIGPREISRKFGISPTAAQRLVTALENKDCLYFEPATQKYKLGYGLFRLLHGVAGKFDLITIAQPYMKTLRDYTGETICLNVMVEKRRMTTYQVESKHELRWIAEVGKLYPLYIGASGKVILANLDEKTIHEIFQEQLEELDAEKKKALLQQLQEIKTNQFFVSYGERIAGGVGIAVPIEYQNGVASLSIYAPETRIDRQKIVDYVEKLKEAAQQIEREVFLTVPHG